jgi:penicillin-binding protein 1C
MERAGTLSSLQAREALAEQLTLTRDPSPFTAPHFVEMVLANAGGARSGRIETTIDRELQGDVHGIIDSQRAALKQHGAANVAVVVLDNRSGGWLAWEGSGDYFDATHGGTINGPVVPRQPGSALKPFTYALAFEIGFDPASVLPDVPAHFPTAEAGVLYSPRNYDGRYRGPLLARRALAGSENVPAVALASEIGVPNLLRLLLRAGLSTLDSNCLVLRAGHHAWERRGTPGRVGRRLFCIRATGRMGCTVLCRRWFAPGEALACERPYGVLDHRHSV